MRYYEGIDTYNYSWDKVARAFWCRYPNPLSKHVLSEDVIQRSVDSNGRLITKRLLSKTNKTPKWAERFLSTRLVFIIEDSIVDPTNRTFTTFTRNIGLQNFLTIEEKVTYRASPDSSEYTLAERQAWVNSNMFGLSRPVQAFGMERFKSNVGKAKRGFQLVLDAMFSQQETNFDVSAHMHPLLSEKLKERAKSLGEKAKSKVTGSPLVAAAMSTEKQ